jgi:type I restriction enzyme, S subunit
MNRVKREWTKQRLGDLRASTKYAFVGGPFGSNLVSRDYTDKGVPVIRGNNLPTHSTFSLSDLVFVSEKKADALRQNNAGPGDLIFTQRGTLGQVGLIPIDSPYSRFIISQSQMKLTVDKEKADARFLYHYFRLPATIERIIGLAISSGVPHINLNILREFQVLTPPVSIQRKISAILSAYDELIENNKRRIALLEKLAVEIYREWFVRLRFPGHQRVKCVGARPASWVPGRLGDIANITMGQSPPSNTYNESGDGLQFHQGVGTYGHRFPRKRTFCTATGRKARKGDILFSVRAPVGRLNIADSEMIIGRGLAAMRHKQGYNSYLYYLLKLVFADEDIIGNGSIFNSVGKDELAKFQVLQPDEHLVKLFEAQAEPIDKHIAALDLSVEYLTQTRDLLLPRLISGKLSVENLEIQLPPGMMKEPCQDSNVTPHA